VCAGKAGHDFGGCGACKLTRVIVRMETPTTSPAFSSTLTDINGLRHCGIFPAGREPSIRTLRSWTKLRRIPYHKVGHFVLFDVAEVTLHIRAKLKVPARG
jgi:hypothetical protein